MEAKEKTQKSTKIEPTPTSSGNSSSAALFTAENIKKITNHLKTNGITGYLPINQLLALLGINESENKLKDKFQSNENGSFLNWNDKRYNYIEINGVKHFDITPLVKEYEALSKNQYIVWNSSAQLLQYVAIRTFSNDPVKEIDLDNFVTILMGLKHDQAFPAAITAVLTPSQYQQLLIKLLDKEAENFSKNPQNFLRTDSSIPFQAFKQEYVIRSTEFDYIVNCFKQAADKVSNIAGQYRLGGNKFTPIAPALEECHKITNSLITDFFNKDFLKKIPDFIKHRCVNISDALEKHKYDKTAIPSLVGGYLILRVFGYLYNAVFKKMNNEYKNTNTLAATRYWEAIQQLLPYVLQSPLQRCSTILASEATENKKPEDVKYNDKDEIDWDASLANVSIDGSYTWKDLEKSIVEIVAIDNINNTRQFINGVITAGREFVENKSDKQNQKQVQLPLCEHTAALEQIHRVSATEYTSADKLLKNFDQALINYKTNLFAAIEAKDEKAAIAQIEALRKDANLATPVTIANIIFSINMDGWSLIAFAASKGLTKLVKEFSAIADKHAANDNLISHQCRDKHILVHAANANTETFGILLAAINNAIINLSDGFIPQSIMVAIQQLIISEALSKANLKLLKTFIENIPKSQRITFLNSPIISEIQTNKELTLLDTAAYCGQIEVVKYLLKAGATSKDKSAKDIIKQTEANFKTSATKSRSNSHADIIKDNQPERDFRRSVYALLTIKDENQKTENPMGRKRSQTVSEGSQSETSTITLITENKIVAEQQLLKVFGKKLASIPNSVPSKSAKEHKSEIERKYKALVHYACTNAPSYSSSKIINFVKDNFTKEDSTFLKMIVTQAAETFKKYFPEHNFYKNFKQEIINTLPDTPNGKAIKAEIQSLSVNSDEKLSLEFNK